MRNTFERKFPGNEFHKKGEEEITKLPEHLRFFALWGSPEEHDIALRIIREKGLITDAGEEQIDEERYWLRAVPMGEEDQKLVNKCKETYRKLFEYFANDERSKMKKTGEIIFRTT